MNNYTLAKRRWYLKNRERIIAASKRRYFRNRKNIRAKRSVKNKQEYKRYRKAVLKAFGCRCNWRGCKWVDARALQLDHKKGKGSLERKKLGGVDTYKRALLYPEEYQLLCANHNWVKRVKDREALVFSRKPSCYWKGSRWHKVQQKRKKRLARYCIKSYRPQPIRPPWTK